MTKEIMKVLELVEEMRMEEKKTKRVPHYYMRKGQLVERSYPDYIQTERYKELFFGDAIRGQKVFKCCECGCMVDYFSLSYESDYEEDDYLCESCYEDDMGEDL